MQKRRLGKNGPEVSAMGLGCMGMSQWYGTRDDVESTATIHRALELGVNLIDTADMYGPFINEELIGNAIKGKRDKVFLATKFGFVGSIKDLTKVEVDGKPEHVYSACEGSLKRLQVDTIDIYYLHRVDPNTPIEETVGAMANLVKQGKIRCIGLCEVNSQTLHKAHKIHPISAVQSEYSLFTRDPEVGVLKTCRELGVAFIPFSPLGRGFLTGQMKQASELSENDNRRNFPRFQGENFQKNMLIVERLNEMASQKKCTAAQLALAWVLAQGEDIIPIPGTKRRKYLEQNIASLDVHLNEEDLQQIEKIIPRDSIHGDRYKEDMAKLTNQ